MTAIDARLDWRPPGGVHLGGMWRTGNDELHVYDPEDGDFLASVHCSTPDDVRSALTGLSQAFTGNKRWPLWQRREAMYAASELVRAEGPRLAALISSEGSKTISEATREVRRTSETLRLTAELADRMSGETLPTDNTARGEGRFGWFTREPVGVVAAVTPFNDPLNLVAHKVAPALLAGNVVALKPAEATPLSALALTEILITAGVPAERIAVLPGTGEGTGDALVRDPRVDLVSFTGGYHTGDAIARAAGAKRLLMELGGNCAVIVLKDADLDVAVEAIVDGAFGCAGQNCVSVQRVLVDDAVAAAVLDGVVQRTLGLKVGTKSSPGTDVGPMIDERAARRAEDVVADARRFRAEVHVGGNRTGTFFEPTVITGAVAPARLLTDEVFGPVVSIDTFKDLDVAIAKANDTDFGLQAGVFTGSIDLALEIASELRVGGVMINDTSDFRIDAMPFGGVRHSGLGREGVRFTLEAMTEPKVVMVKRLT